MSVGSVVAIGVFDGVHRGHQALLKHAKDLARARQTRLIVASFDPHPLTVVAPGRAPMLLSVPAERRALLMDAGADEVVFIPFTQDVAALSAEEFARVFIVDSWHASGVVVGENFRFGHQAQGDVRMLADIGATLGFSVDAVPLAADAVPWSSTRVRSHLSEGQIEPAAKILGHPVVLTAPVVHGDHRGRELGYPTANLGIPSERLVPGDGIYAGFASWVDTSGTHFRLPAAISIGNNPQFGGAERRVEVFILDLPQADADLYGRELTVEFAAKVRDQVVFATLDEYLAQMPRDIEAIRRLC